MLQLLQGSAVPPCILLAQEAKGFPKLGLHDTILIYYTLSSHSPEGGTCKAGNFREVNLIRFCFSADTILQDFHSSPTSPLVAIFEVSYVVTFVL